LSSKEEAREAVRRVVAPLLDSAGWTPIEEKQRAKIRTLYRSLETAQLEYVPAIRLELQIRRKVLAESYALALRKFSWAGYKDFDEADLLESEDDELLNVGESTLAGENT
jgi:hypothetical protein